LLIFWQEVEVIFSAEIFKGKFCLLKLGVCVPIFSVALKDAFALQFSSPAVFMFVLGFLIKG